MLLTNEDFKNTKFTLPKTAATVTNILIQLSINLAPMIKNYSQSNC
jgi:hypothetical protein